MPAGPKMPSSALESLRDRLVDLGRVAVAVSGGVDSMTLAVVTGRLLGERAAFFHAVSSAVPPEATERVRRWAEREGWELEVIDAGELRNPDYLRNPADRCFFCKFDLYGAIAARTRAIALSGTNADDLSDYRPGLEAAREHGVRHPFVEAGIDKATVRAIARELGLGELSELPASPCLSSRIETGIRIRSDVLELVHAVERYLTRELTPRTVRCRVRASGVVVELDAPTLERIGARAERRLGDTIAGMWRTGGHDVSVGFAPYRTGSAFLRKDTDRAAEA
jgi:uncharacterized protein